MCQDCAIGDVQAHHIPELLSNEWNEARGVKGSTAASEQGVSEVRI